jgi:hypothetical protein
MKNNPFVFYEHHLDTILIIHLIISILFSLLISFYALKRFKKSTAKIDLQDQQRLQGIENKSWFFKLLFKASLHKNNQIAIFLFTFLFNISVPFLGYFFTLWIFWYMVNVKYEEKILDTNILDLDEFQESFLEVERLFGEGSMINIMNNDYIPKSKKLKALSTLAAANSPMSLHVVKQTLSSKDDEIRMFGYAIINKAETAINSSINKNLAIISEEVAKGEQKDEERIASASKELAQLYWEMVYAELAHESLKVNFLNSVIAYLEVAKEYYIPQLDAIIEKIKKYEIEDKELNEIEEIRKEREHLEEAYITCAGLFSLMGRVYMHRGQYEEAKAELTVAKELLSERSTFLVPYLAELYFITQKYNIVHSLLENTQGLKYSAKLYPVIKQWEDAS